MILKETIVLEHKMPTGTIQKLEDGILVYRPDEEHGKNPTLESLQAEYDAFMKIQNGTKSPLLVYTADMSKMDPKTKEFVTSKSDHFASKIAIVAKSAMPVFLFNALIYLSRPSIPAKVFKVEKEAIEWLRS